MKLRQDLLATGFMDGGKTFGSPVRHNTTFPTTPRVAIEA